MTPRLANTQGFARSFGAKKTSAAPISSTIISSPPSVIQWLMKPVIREGV